MHSFTVRGGRFEDVEIIYQHCDVVISKIENLNVMLSDESKIAEQFRRNTGKLFKTFLKQYYEAKYSKQPLPKPPVGNGPKDFLKQIAPHLKDPYLIIRYGFQWCDLARWQLLFLSQTMSDFDIRWNQFLTLRFCKIFTTYCRVAIFFHKLPLILPLVQLCPLVDLQDMQGYLYEADNVVKFVDKCIIDPFECIRSILKGIKDKLNRLAGTLSSFIAKLFGQVPLIDWNEFSVFAKQAANPESTLPPDEFFILDNINLLKDTLIYFICIFSDTINNDDSFDLITENLLTESPVIPITPTTRLSIDQFFKYSKTQVINDDISKIIELNAKRKFNIGHRRRILNVKILLEDIVNLCQYDNSLLPKFFPNITALCGLGYYELDQYFTYDLVCPEALDLLSLLIETARLVHKTSADIQRFYIFNLATIDLEFLKALLSPISEDSAISKNLYGFVHALESIDLDEYDNGYNYCFQRFIITFGSFLCTYNKLKSCSVTSFAEPLFEHMTTIINHIHYGYNSLAAFFEICPLHQLWCHSDKFEMHIKDKNVPLSKCIKFLEIFNYFNRSVMINIYPNEIEKQKEIFFKIKNALYERISSDIHEQFSNSSYFVKAEYETSLSIPSKFETKLFEISKGAICNEVLQAFREANQKVYEIQECFKKLPKNVNLFGADTECFKYFETNITNSIQELILTKESRNYSLELTNKINITFQVLWPLYSLVNQPFLRTFFKYILDQSSLPGTDTYLDQVNLLNGHYPLETNFENNKIIFNICSKIQKFFENEEFTRALYLKELNSFYSNNSIVFSLNYFNSLINNLGIYPGILLQRCLYDIITDSLLSVFNGCKELSLELTAWFYEFQNSKNIPIEAATNKTIENASINMIRIGCAIVLCNLIRQAIQTKSEESVPGILNIIESAKTRMTISLNEKEFLITEIASLSCNNDLHFLRTLISEKNITQQDNFIMFMFFLSLTFAHNRWNNLECISKYESMTENINVFPVAMNLIIYAKQLLFMADDDYSIQIGIKTFLRSLSQIADIKKQKGNYKFVNAINQFVKLLPDEITNLQYGIIEQEFPNSHFNVKINYEGIKKKSRRKRSILFL